MRQTIRAWTEVTETFVLEVILEDRRGKDAAILRTVLLGLSKLFQIGVKASKRKAAAGDILVDVVEEVVN